MLRQANDFDRSGPTRGRVSGEESVGFFLRSDTCINVRADGMAESDGIADSQVHPLPAKRRMNMRGISDEKDLPGSHILKEGACDSAPDSVRRGGCEN